MKKKMTVFALGAVLFALSVSVEVQQAKKVPMVGLLMSSSSVRGLAIWV